MNRPVKKPAPRPAKKAVAAAKKAPGRVAAKKSTSTRQRTPQPPASIPPPVESAIEALERGLRELAIGITGRRAPLVAVARSLARGIDDAEPTDRAKLSKELRSVWGDLTAEAKPSDDDDDWTAPDGDATVRDPPKRGATDARTPGRRNGGKARASTDAVAAPRR